MLTKQTAALAFGALAFAPSGPPSAEGFSGNGRPTVRQSVGGHHEQAGAKGMPRSQGISSSSTLETSVNGRHSSGIVSTWSSLHLQHHHHQHHQHHHQPQQHRGRRRQRRVSPSSSSSSNVGMALSAGAPPKEQDSAASPRSSSSPSTSHGTNLDDHTYVAAIIGGIPDFMEVVDQSLSGDLVTIVTYMPWCRSCHHLRHHLRVISKAHAIADSGAMFYEMDLDSNREVHKMLDIHAAPTVLLYSSGQLVDEFICSGASGPKVLLRHIEEQVGAVPDLRSANAASIASASSTSGKKDSAPHSVQNIAKM